MIGLSGGHSGHAACSECTRLTISRVHEPCHVMPERVHFMPLVHCRPGTSSMPCQVRVTIEPKSPSQEPSLPKAHLSR